MWKPEEGKTYKNSKTGQIRIPQEVPNTFGEPTHISENRIVVSLDDDENKISEPVIWWHKRRGCMEIQ